MIQKRILVSGGASFLGSHLCEKLLADGHDVLAVDNYFTGRCANITHMHGHPYIKIMRHDITFPLYVEVDEIYNLACPASPVHYQFGPLQSTKVSVVRAIKLLDLAKRLKARILQASTSEVYGVTTAHPQTEDYRGGTNTIGPRNCYDEGKRCEEILFIDYLRQHTLHIKLALIFNTYGPRMHLEIGRLVSNFVAQAVKGENVTIFGDGMPTQAFCYVGDRIDGLERLTGTPDNVAGPINPGNPVEMPMAELAQWVMKLTGSRSNLVFRPLPVDNLRQRRQDISKAEAIIGWETMVQVDEGLTKTIGYFPVFLETMRHDVRRFLSANGAAAQATRPEDSIRTSRQDERVYDAADLTGFATLRFTSGDECTVFGLAIWTASAGSHAETLDEMQFAKG